MLIISHLIAIPESELKITFIRSPGPGGQNVNKLATTAVLRFNVVNTRFLPEDVKLRFVSIFDSKLTNGGDLLIKASRYRTQARNKQDALERLQRLLNRALVMQKKRKKTKPSLASKERRLTKKKLVSKTKDLRRSPFNKEA